MSRVAVVYGGRSSEHDVSMRSGEAVARGLEEAGHEVLRVTVSRDGRWSSEGVELALTPGRGLLGADVCFPVMHGPFGEDGSAQGLLEWLDVPYVGSDVLSSSICMDKLTLKRLCGQAGLPQVEFTAVGEEGWRERCAELGSPLWVKPSRLGSSVGISRVEGTGEALEAAVELALGHDPRVIVEASANGREVECSLLGNEEVEVSPPGEIVAHGDWYDYETKYSAGGMELVVPAPIPDDRPPVCVSWRLRPSGSGAAPGWRAATSSSSPTAPSSSTRSTPSRASPRPASTPSSGRPAASATGTSATASSSSRSSATSGPGPSTSESSGRRRGYLAILNGVLRLDPPTLAVSL